MTQPLVSVVIPIYNVEKYLEECFNSVVKQSYENLEIILVNDGSTDNSGEIADRLAVTDARAFVIHKGNGGLSDARNAGIDYAKGEYITFIDSDDWVSDEFVNCLMKTALDKGADIVQCDNSRDPSKLGCGNGKSTMLSGKDAFIELMKYKTVSPTAWGKVYKTSLFRSSDLKFPVGRIHEDTAILYKLIFLANIVICLDRVLYYYRINTNSIMTANYTKKHYESVAKYHQELDDYIIGNQIHLAERILLRHKALRLLSVLNKLALNNMINSVEYNKFKKEYYVFARGSLSIFCIVGSVPVKYPVVFRSFKYVTPKIRKVLGKV